MKTADLIASLVADARPVAPGAVARRLAPPTLCGLAVAVTIVILWLGLRSFDEASRTFAFWMKGAYTVTLAVAGAMIAARLARPGGAGGAGRWLALAAVAVMLGLSAREFAAAPAGERIALWLGGSWNVCPLRILVIGAPICLGLLFGMRRLAPTRPTLAGASAGFLAGALGATAYQLFCPETGAMFVTTWYTLGVVASAALGALIGRYALRW
jgi:hypothetical protein